MAGPSPASGNSTLPASAACRPAAHKRSQRTELVRQAGINPAPLTSIDFIDAALCALAAHQLASGRPCRADGEAGSGLIVVPQVPDWSDWTA